MVLCEGSILGEQTLQYKYIFLIVGDEAFDTHLQGLNRPFNNFKVEKMSIIN